MRWVGLPFIVLGLAGIASGLVWASSVDDYGSVPLTRGLPRQTIEVSPAFDKRVQAIFPNGSSEQTMLATLRAQGFIRKTTVQGQENLALRTESNLACGFDYAIRWRTNQRDVVASSRGEVAITCL